MRIKLEVDDRTVELEDEAFYWGEGKDKAFLNMLKHALQSLGYKKSELIVVWSQPEEK
jgi:hypothetical protein